MLGGATPSSHWTALQPACTVDLSDMTECGVLYYFYARNILY